MPAILVTRHQEKHGCGEVKLPLCAWGERGAFLVDGVLVCEEQSSKLVILLEKWSHP